jgi:periplasmic copper chaperone A
MTSNFLRGSLRALLLASALLSTAAHAHETVSADGTIKLESLWTRATPNGAKVAGGFLTITNTGKLPDRLIGGSAVIAGRVEIHEMSMDGGVMKMRALDQGLEIKPGETIELKPGSFHVMLIDLKEGVKEGDKVMGTLVFERAGTVETYYHGVALGGTKKVHDHH